MLLSVPHSTVGLLVEVRDDRSACCLAQVPPCLAFLSAAELEQSGASQACMRAAVQGDVAHEQLLSHYQHIWERSFQLLVIMAQGPMVIAAGSASCAAGSTAR